MEDSKLYLQKILSKIENRIKEVDEAIVTGAEDVRSMQEYYWENYTEMDEYGYENFDNQQALFRQLNANTEQLRFRQRLIKMMDSPYFGRVDFLYDDEDEPESFYIGIANFSDGAGHIPLIYDWRAPVSSLFYDYDKGEASYTAPSGEITGEIISKHQYKIQSGKLIYEFESDVKVDDEVLKRELGSSGDTKLKNIISTIQKEQNAIIRNTKDKILVIQGTAGSGKTSVGFHRIAYLLYHDRKNLKSSNVLILSPNSVFSDYISHILPELGEENIQEMSFDLFAYKQLKDMVYDCEDRYDRMEAVLSLGRDTSYYKEKQSKEFVKKLNGFVLELEDELMDFKDVKFGKMYKAAGEIMELFYYKFTDIPLMMRMNFVMDYVVDQYETLIGKDFSEEDMELIKEKFMRMYRTRDLYVLYSRFLEQNGYPGLAHVPYEKRTLKYEDVYPMLYLKYQLYSPVEHKNIRHLVIDEMQDYSYLQYLIIEKLFKCHMTILGDKAQTMDEEVQDVTRFLPRILGKGIRTIVMDKGYRNTVEIAEYAAGLIGVAEQKFLERHGKPVSEREFADFNTALDEVIRSLINAKGEYETAAIIAMTETEARAAHAYIINEVERKGIDLEVSYIDKNSSQFSKGLTITTFYLAKGLEFEHVFALYDSNKDTSLYKQAKYICATRALHELNMFGYGSFI